MTLSAATSWEALRVTHTNQCEVAIGDYVLYCMTAARRTRANFGLQRALHWSRTKGVPLLVIEALRCGYPWASDRLHNFVMEGMVDQRQAFEKAEITYLSYVEPQPGAGKGLIAALAKHACVVVADEFPAFFLPQMHAALARQVSCRMELVDSNGLFPMRAFSRHYPSAALFRRAWQKLVNPHLTDIAQHPQQLPLAKVDASSKGAKVPKDVQDNYEFWNADASTIAKHIAKLPIDHTVAAVPMERGGQQAALRKLNHFVSTLLPDYADLRSDPDTNAASGLSPYLHFGHIGAHEIAHAVWQKAEWTPAKFAPKANGSREGFWNLPRASESFMDELLTWRELGYGFCHFRPDYAQYESLPGWAQETLAKHSSDPREHLYSLAQLEHSKTYDELWNAAQRQLAREGTIQNYLRMLWGKKILEWTESPQQALEFMVHLNNKYALDGRNPNSYSGIFWTLGRFDRPWGPERKIFGSIRFMSSANTAKKWRVKNYLIRFSPGVQQKKLPL